MNHFKNVLLNTLIANVTTSYLWFAVTFWAYLETQSVLATSIIGGSYMLLVAIFSIVFGTIVDHHKKKSVMVFSGWYTSDLCAGCRGLLAVAGWRYYKLGRAGILAICRYIAGRCRGRKHAQYRP